jgi:DNA-binding transcriptional ArsR family regulator
MVSPTDSGHTMSEARGPGGGWRVGRSIAIELDAAVYLVRAGPAVLPRDLADLAVAVPSAWLDEFDTLSPSAAADPGIQSIVELMARWAEVLEVEDYDEASAAMREVGAEDAIAQVVSASGLEPASGLEDTERLIDLERRLAVELPERVGLYPTSDAAVAERRDQVFRVAAGALRGGPLHGRFWHWMDRFYYEAYRGWRATRRDAMASLERTAVDGLGGRAGDGVPELAWLPDANPIDAMPTLRTAVEAGEFQVVFWVEPFGLSHTWTLAPGLLLLSFAETGPLHDRFITIRDELATRLKALADPTRLSILKMIRSIDFDNTQLAGYLGVSRPTVSVHTKLLAEAGFISTARAGRQARHTFHPDSIRSLLDDLLRYLDVPRS